MSKAVKTVKKWASSAWKAVKEVAPYVLGAVAVYFTAGVALSYFSATSSFAASMPGFGAGGMFTKGATAMGLSGPASAAAAQSAGSAAAMAGTASKAIPAAMGGAGGGTSASVATMGSQAAKGAATASLSTSGISADKAAASGEEIGAKTAAEHGLGEAGGQQLAGQTPGVEAGGGQAPGGGATDAGKSVSFGATETKGMSTVEKLLVAKTVVDTAGGLMADKPRDPHESFWGYSRGGEGMDIISNDPGRQVQNITPQQPVGQVGEFMPQQSNRSTARTERPYQTGYTDTRQGDGDE